MISLSLSKKGNKRKYRRACDLLLCSTLVLFDVARILKRMKNLLFPFPLHATGEVDSTQLSHAPTESEHLAISPLKVRWVSLSFLLKRTPHLLTRVVGPEAEAFVG